VVGDVGLPYGKPLRVYVPQPNLRLILVRRNLIFALGFAVGMLGNALPQPNLRVNLLSRTTVRFCNLPSYPTRFYIRTELPLSPGQIWTPSCTPDKFPFTSSDFGEYSRDSHRNHAKTHIVETKRARVVVAISRPTIPGIVVPRTATQQLKSSIPSSVSQLIEKFDYI
jgi:hypothetical protein